jgi:hypothetical protein
LDLVIARTVKEVLINGIAFRRNQRKVRLPVRVLKLGRARLEKNAQITSILLRRVLLSPSTSVKLSMISARWSKV